MPGSPSHDAMTQVTQPGPGARPPTGVTNLNVVTPAQSGGAGTHHGKVWGDFQLGDLLGKGGMGAVYRGRQLSLDREVAIKVLPPHLSSNEDFRTRFQVEARAVARIRSEHVIQVYAAGQHEGNHFFAMEYVEGDDLAGRLKKGWRPSHREVLNLIVQAARGLAAAGEHGIIHRDIKPANMMLTAKGVLKLMDFGLAKLASRDTGLTMAGTIMGTVNYFSPEQGRGEICDHRTDIYALGVVFYELLTTRLPFTGQDATSIIYQHIHQPPKAPREIDPQIPDGYQAVVLKCMQKKPEQRYQTAAELVEDLEALVAGRMPQTAFLDPSALRSGGDMVRSEPFARERKGRSALVAGVLIAAVSGGAAWWFVDGQARFAPKSLPSTTGQQAVQTQRPVQTTTTTVVVVPDLAPARAHLTAKRWPQARALVQAALADFPQDPDWLALRAEVDASEGADHLATAEQALGAGDLDRARAALAAAQQAMGETPEVKALSARFDASLTNANAREVALTQSRASLAEGDITRAESILAAYLAAQPEDALIERELRAVRARRQEAEERHRAAAEQISNGQRAIERRDYDVALLAFTAALQHEPGSQAARQGLAQVTKLKEDLALERQRFDTALAARDLDAARTSLATMRKLAPGSATVVLAENEFQQSRLEQDAAEQQRRAAEAALTAKVEALRQRIDDPAASNADVTAAVTALSAELSAGDARREQLASALNLRIARQDVAALLVRLDAAVLQGETAQITAMIADTAMAERLGRLHTFDGLVFASSLTDLTSSPEGVMAQIAIRHAFSEYPEQVLHYRADMRKVADAWRIVAATLEPR